MYSDMLRLTLEADGDTPATSVADLVAVARRAELACRPRPTGRRLAPRERRTCR